MVYRIRGHGCLAPILYENIFQGGIIMDRKHRRCTTMVPVGNFTVGGGSPLVLIAGPCVIEEMDICLKIIAECQRVCTKYGINYVFKASYDKANKTIAGSYRGPGRAEGMSQLYKIKEATDIPILTDVHEGYHCPIVGNIADVLQIPALLSKQIDLITEAASYGTINIKKGQFTAPWDMENVIGRLESEGFRDVMVTERGYTFVYGDLVNDMRALEILSDIGKPVIFDVSHSVCGMFRVAPYQTRKFIPGLVRSAVANGVDGIFVEVHPRPDEALSDAAGTLALSEVESLVRHMVAIDEVNNG